MKRSKLLYILYQPYKWLFLLPVGSLLTVIYGILAIVFSLIIGERFGNKFVGVWWARTIGLLTPIQVKLKGKEHVKKGQSYVIVANHISAYDIIAVYGWLDIEFKWVMKKELRKVPGIGYGSAAIGHIFIDRSNTQAAIKSISEAKEKINDGVSVVFFPEGTRSNDDAMAPFKKGAFRFALDLQLPVLPLTIVGTDNMMPNGTFDIYPGKGELIIHPPISIEDYSVESMKALMDKSKEAIASSIPENS